MMGGGGDFIAPSQVDEIVVPPGGPEVAWGRGLDAAPGMPLDCVRPGQPCDDGDPKTFMDTCGYNTDTPLKVPGFASRYRTNEGGRFDPHALPPLDVAALLADRGVIVRSPTPPHHHTTLPRFTHRCTVVTLPRDSHPSLPVSSLLPGECPDRAFPC